MLRLLHVENYALIDRLDINFTHGFTVITGETGAGKSILLGALSLLLGQRADTQVIHDMSRKCIVEGSFDIGAYGLQAFFEKWQLDYDAIGTIRREISPQGKSRAFINDTPVNLPLLKEFADKLIDIHSQHQNLLIGESSFQFDVVDSFSESAGLLDAYQKKYYSLQQRRRQLEQWEEEQKRLDADLDYNQFQLEELQKTPLNQDAYTEWEADLDRYKHAEEIKSRLETAAFLMNEDDHSLLDILRDILGHVKALENFGKQYEAIVSRLNPLFIELKDIGHDMQMLSQDIVPDPEAAMQLEAQLNNINRLLLKHRANTVEELIEIREQYAAKVASAHSLADNIRQEKEHIEKAASMLQALATEIHNKRRLHIPAMEQEIVGKLKQLGMPGAKFVVACSESKELNKYGCDQISFLFSANADTEPIDIARVASGGELSRVMLCVKSLLSQKKLLPSILFDEIDTGISGETGGKIGRILKEMAKGMQVIAITHLPQIAAKGDSHLLVYKLMEDGKTTSRIIQLADSERMAEIAKMLGGEKPTASMIATAGELLSKHN